MKGTQLANISSYCHLIETVSKVKISLFQAMEAHRVARG
jgi:hypothetical protein